MQARQQDAAQRLHVGLLGRVGEAVLVEAEGREQRRPVRLLVGVAAGEAAQRLQRRQRLLEIRIAVAHLDQVDAGVVQLLLRAPAAPVSSLSLQGAVAEEADGPQRRP